MLGEIEDGIADELAGTVVRDVAAAAGLVEIDAQQTSLVGVEQHMVAVGRSAERQAHRC